MDHDLTNATWRKATKSSTNGQCVEVAFLDNGDVAIRDSKHPDGPVLHYTALEWECFVDGVEHGEFNRA